MGKPTVIISRTALNDAVNSAVRSVLWSAINVQTGKSVAVTVDINLTRIDLVALDNFEFSWVD